MRSAVLPITALAALVGLLLGIVLLYVLEVRYWVVQSRAEADSVGDTQARGPDPFPSDGAAAHEPPRRGRPRISHDLDLAF